VTRILDPVIEALRADIYRMGSRAESILDKALTAVRERNAMLALEVADDDVEIDRLDVEIDGAVLRALALQAPVGVDLREVLAIKMVATDLERVGDLARNIAKSARRMSEQRPLPMPPDLARLAASAQGMLHRALDAFAERDAQAASAVLAEDDRLDSIQDAVIQEAVRAIQSQPDDASPLLDVILIAKHLERVGDHATNVAEDVILMAEARNVKHAAKLGGPPAPESHRTGSRS
jgi:phosphate transport system protein